MTDTEEKILLDSLRQTDLNFSNYAADHGVGKAFETFCSPDVVHISGQGYPIVGREQVVQNMNQFSLTYTMVWQPQVVQINDDHHTGVTKGSYTLFKLIPTQPSEEVGTGTYLTIWKKDLSGDWKAIYDMDGSIFQN